MSNPEDTLADEFLKHISEHRRLSQYTHRNYGHAINVFFNWLRKKETWNGDIDAITKNQLRGFVIEFQNTHSRRTLHNWASALRMYVVNYNLCFYYHFHFLILSNSVS